MVNLILVGPMGAGKSTIGRLLAKELHLAFKDSDKEIEQRCGANIPWIFDVEGEVGFREREQAMLTELCAADGMVLRYPIALSCLGASCAHFTSI